MIIRVSAPFDTSRRDEDTLNYNAMQLSVQRRLNRGLQMGLAYTLSKSEGIQGYDWATEELFGEQGLRDRYYGPPTVTTAQLTNITGVTRADRRHVLVFNYSYEIPTLNLPVLKQLLGDWEASGVTQFNTGNALDPICGTTLGGVANIDPSLSGVFRAGTTIADLNNTNSRCELTGEPLFTGQPRSEPGGRRSDALQSERVPPALAERIGRKLRERPDWRAAPSRVLELGLHAVAPLQDRRPGEPARAAPGVQLVQPGGIRRAQCGLPVRRKRRQYRTRHGQVHDDNESKERGTDDEAGFLGTEESIGDSGLGIWDLLSTRVALSRTNP